MVKFGAEEEIIGVVFRKRLLDEGSRVGEMFQHLEGRDAPASAQVVAVLEAGRNDVPAVFVRPVEVEAYVTHQSGEKPVASGNVDVAPLPPLSCQPEKDRREFS